jgi:serine protease Do
VNDEFPTLPDTTAPADATSDADAPADDAVAHDATPTGAALGDSTPTSAGRRRGGLRNTLVGAVAGGLVGALVASGVFLVADDGNTTTTIVKSPGQAAAVARPSATINDKLDLAAIIAKAEPAVVAIATNGGVDTQGGSAGTGFVISPDGYLVTNNHVVADARTIEAAFSDGTTRKATLVGRDPSADLAVLKVDATNLATLQLGDSNAVQVGDDVVAIGNALALEGGLSVTKGIISGKDRTVSDDAGSTIDGALQTDAAINHGNSGGPLLNSQAQVIGINSAIADPSYAQNVGFAIPISRAEPVIADLRAGRKPAFLGVATSTVTPEIANEANLDVSSGAYVEVVTKGSPADKAGIHQGDVIVEISGTKIAGSGDVLAAVRSHRPGESVKVVVDRGGSRKTFDATLAERTDAS